MIKCGKLTVNAGALQNCRTILQDPSPTMETITSLLPTICSLLNFGDKHVLSDACWALSYITDASNDRIQVGIAREVHLLLQVYYCQDSSGYCT